jgi:hypothetical protein
MVYLPASGLLFTGDVLMPYLGVPFTAEGSPEGLLETLRYIRGLAPRRLIAGHTTLTENFTIETLTGLDPALTELHGFALARIDENTPLPNILDPRSQEERAAALDLLAGEKADAFAYAAATLADQGDLALALEIITPGLLRHPDSSELAELRQGVVTRLMEQRQSLDPFGFLFYAELAGAELTPIR